MGARRLGKMAEHKDVGIEVTDAAGPEMPVLQEQGLIARLEKMMTKYTLRIAFVVALLATLDLTSDAFELWDLSQNTGRATPQLDGYSQSSRVQYQMGTVSLAGDIAEGKYGGGKPQLGSATCGSSKSVISLYRSKTVSIRDSVLNQTSYSQANLSTYTDTAGVATPTFTCSDLKGGNRSSGSCNDDNSPYTCGDCDPLGLLGCSSASYSALEPPSQATVQINFKYTRQCQTWVTTSSTPPTNAGEEFCYAPDSPSYGWKNLDSVPPTLSCPAGYTQFMGETVYSGGCYTPPEYQGTYPYSGQSAGPAVCLYGQYRNTGRYFRCYSIDNNIFGRWINNEFGHWIPTAFSAPSGSFDMKPDKVQAIVLVLGLMILTKESIKLVMIATIPFTDVVRKHPGRFKYCLTSPFALLLFLKPKYRELIRLTSVSQDATWPTLIDLFLEDGPQLFFPMYQAIYFEVTGLVYFTLTTSILMVLVNVVRVVVGLYRSVHQEADSFDKELQEMRAGLEGAPAPAPVPVSAELGTMGTALAPTPDELVGLINSLVNDNKRIHERLALVENEMYRREVSSR